MTQHWEHKICRSNKTSLNASARIWLDGFDYAQSSTQYVHVDEEEGFSSVKEKLFGFFYMAFIYLKRVLSAFGTVIKNKNSTIVLLHVEQENLHSFCSSVVFINRQIPNLHVFPLSS